jgi:hypothetical protein
MLDNDSLANVIGRLDKRDARVIVITAWACSPLLVCNLFKDFRDAKIVVFFQNHSYDSFYDEFKAESTPCIESIDYKQQQLCKREYMKHLIDEVHTQAAPPLVFYNYQVNKRDSPFQMHAKTLTVLYETRAEYVQYSWNMDDRHVNKRALVYRGFQVTCGPGRPFWCLMTFGSRTRRPTRPPTAPISTVGTCVDKSMTL